LPECLDEASRREHHIDPELFVFCRCVPCPRSLRAACSRSTTSPGSWSRPSRRCAWWAWWPRWAFVGSTATTWYSASTWSLRRRTRSQRGW